MLTFGASHARAGQASANKRRGVIEKVTAEKFEPVKYLITTSLLFFAVMSVMFLLFRAAKPPVAVPNATARVAEGELALAIRPEVIAAATQVMHESSIMPSFGSVLTREPAPAAPPAACA